MNQTNKKILRSTLIYIKPPTGEHHKNPKGATILFIFRTENETP